MCVWGGGGHCVITVRSFFINVKHSALWNSMNYVHFEIGVNFPVKTLNQTGTVYRYINVKAILNIP